jgi:hypothetical protein
MRRTLSRTPRSVGVGSAVTTTKSAAVVAARAATVAARVNFMFAFASLFFLCLSRWKKEEDCSIKMCIGCEAENSEEQKGDGICKLQCFETRTVRAAQMPIYVLYTHKTQPRTLSQSPISQGLRPQPAPVDPTAVSGRDLDPGRLNEGERGGAQRAMTCIRSTGRLHGVWQTARRVALQSSAVADPSSLQHPKARVEISNAHMLLSDSRADEGFATGHWRLCGAWTGRTDSCLSRC